MITVGNNQALPKNWNWVKAKDVIDIRDGTHNSPQYQTDGIPLITSKNLANGKIDFSTCGYISQKDHEEISKRSSVDNGDILFAMIGTIGNPVIVSKEFEFSIKNVALFKFLNSHVHNRYFLHILNSNLVTRQFDKKSRGGTQKFISLGNIRELEIPLPPLPEQKRIAAILDAADALRTQRRQSIAELDLLLQSTFLEMFGDPVENPKGWVQDNLKNIFNFTTGKLDSNAAVTGGKYPFFTCSRETFAINDAAFDCEALLLAGNNASADYSVKYYNGKFNAYQRTYVITLKNKNITYKYAKLALEYLLIDLKRFSKGSNTKYITMGILNNMPILLPSLSLQQKFAEIVEAIEAQKTRLQAHLAELDTLFASLQQRAFNGEL